MLTTVICALRRWNDERRAIDMLTRLSDDRLCDIGYTRGSLERIIKDGSRL